jgi:hypothetical protein
VAKSHRKLEAQPGSVEGDFYAEKDTCIWCGVPQSVAPDLVGKDKEDACIWKKQPTTPEELDRAINVLNHSCCAAHRYAGTDASVWARINEPGLCDDLPDRERLSAERNATRMDEEFDRWFAAKKEQWFDTWLGRWFRPRDRGQ